MADLTPLPRSLDPLPDESLPGYLLRLAHRLALTPLRVLQLTGLSTGQTPTRSTPQRLMMDLDPAAAESFARATRLTTTEVADLCFSSMSDRYPLATSAIISDRWDPRSVATMWLFTSATRYCPQCLAGDGSPLQQQHGGAWCRTWRLPIVFACPTHHRLLEHRCPSCASPVMSASIQTTRHLIARPGRGGLHPTQCRALQTDTGSSRAHFCGAQLSRPAPPTDTRESPDLSDLLTLQARLLPLLDPQSPTTVISVGHQATTLQYFADLRLATSLISATWPRTRDLISSPDLAAAVDRHISSLRDADPHRDRLREAPPLDPHPGAALVDAAVRILDDDDLRVFGQYLVPHRGDAHRASPRNRWIRRYQRTAQDCSDGFRAALEPLAHTYQRTGRQPHGRRAPASQIGFRPEHIPEQLQDDWFHQHFHHIEGIGPRLLRRAAALRLVQMSTGGSLTEAATFLGIDHRYMAASPGSTIVTSWSTEAGGRAEFRLAVHALLQQLNTTSNLIDYKRRRDALQAWCIDPATWQDLLGRLPRTKGPFQPELGDCKRQFASEVVWARITQGEHVLAPRPIEDQLSHTDPTWNQRRNNMWHFYLAHPPKPHYAALKDLLDAHADHLAGTIDRQP